MKTTSEFAKRFFKKDLDWAERYGPDQYEHSVRILTERFHQEAFLAASAAIFDNLKAEHARCQAAGLIDKWQDRDVERSAVTIADHDALSLRFDDGGNLLFVFSEERKGDGDDEKLSSTLEVFSWADAITDERFAAYQASFQNSASYDDLKPSIEKLADTRSAREAVANAVGDKLGLDLNDLISAIKEGNARGVRSVGKFKRNAFGFMLQHGFFTFDAFTGSKCSLDIIKRMFTSFTPVTEYVGSEGEEYFALLKAGQLDEAFASGCVLSLEYHLQRGALSKIDAIVSASEELGVGMERAMAYDDTKISVYAERRHGRDIYVNTDLDGSCSATVISKLDGKPSTIHIFDLQIWWAGFLNYWGRTETEPLIPGKEIEYARYAFTRGPAFSEHNLVDQLRQGILPEEHAAMIYDFDSGVMNLRKSVEHSGYLTYMTSRIDRDQEILENAVKGEFPEWGAEFNEHSRGDVFFQRLSVEDFTARRTAPSF